LITLGILQPVYKRRTKAEKLADKLPKKNDAHINKVDYGPEQLALYSSIIKQTKDKHIGALAAINALRQICSHPALYDNKYDELPVERVPKLATTMGIIKNIQMKNEKVLIFTNFKKMQIILKKCILKEFSLNPEVINGETSYRQMVVDHFNKSEGFNVLILSPQAAGIGLTITGANHVIHYTRWWNPAVENQATDRAYRIGQTKDVNVYFPIITNSMEEVLNQLIENKRELAENIIVPSYYLDCKDELMKKTFV
jgi:SNF2 family DNA or RNA helicase